VISSITGREKGPTPSQIMQVIPWLGAGKGFFEQLASRQEAEDARL